MYLLLPESSLQTRAHQASSLSERLASYVYHVPIMTGGSSGPQWVHLIMFLRFPRVSSDHACRHSRRRGARNPSGAKLSLQTQPNRIH